jgi:hypothetical protein
MNTHCPKCGAPLTSEDGCTQRFHHFLALEMTDPEYGEVHHLTVAAYMLQHLGQLSCPGWQAMRHLLEQFLSDENFTPALARARNRMLVENRNRSWSFVIGERLVIPAGFVWSRSILSVDYSTPARYRKDIEEWARSVSVEAGTISL